MSSNTISETNLKELEEFQKSTLLYSAETDFNERIKTLLSEKAKEGVNYDPRELDPQISNYQDLFERLKFLYLEQDAKDRFFRKILETNSNINKIDIENANKNIEDWKLKTELKNKSIKEAMEKIDKICEEQELGLSKITEIYESVKAKQQDLKIQNDKLKKLNIENQNNTENDDLSPKLQDLISKYSNLSESDSIINSINEMQKFSEEKVKLLDEKLEDINKMHKTIEDKIQYLQNRKFQYEESLQKNEKLTEKLININNEQSKTIKDPKIQLKLQKHENLKTLMNIWFKITNISNFEFNDDDILHFNYKDFPQTKCLIKFNSSNGLIESIIFDLIHQDKLKQLIIKSNNSSNPLFHASQSIYEEITK
ncbi:WD repeat-containing protein [Wickerhamomyces ciferrii]|uniref:WD repeat-containing protein n=1 Tax=Wickerhamomyces ciferrii (strain ATCC 14091 / BCRC 22168 / CBS 111 / JCM 3599 / NBRC 0793 / NRRL Y-1031 F-60-10) TaxID=1206466 RepID=K0KQQ5_WICCF|nr:WD repeat-containing protein [Wickerhamomyces ciferrii]CCH45406.1 WD repeat-containing protein [Wickerhamomyces ciferrii]